MKDYDVVLDLEKWFLEYKRVLPIYAEQEFLVLLERLKI
jgi:hypothetical protein